MSNTFYTNLFLFAGLFISSLEVSAGNIPQYAVSKGGTPYAEITDGTPLPEMKYDGNSVLFADGNNFIGAERLGEGFPIGFDFRIGGRITDHFAVSNHGTLYLDNDKIGYGTTAFTVGMSTITFGLYKADFSYATTGEEGNRTLTVQYKNAILNEIGKNKGKFNLQIRLYEIDGRIEMAMQELETCYGLGGFVTGLRGWDDDDTILLTAGGLDKPFSISPHKVGDVLENDSYIIWDSDDYDNNYQPVFTFIPDDDQRLPPASPSDLTVIQQADSFRISCRRAEDTPATVVLISDQPFTESDLPTNGETFLAGADKRGRWCTRFGNAIALYYGNSDFIEVSYAGVQPSATYYIRAISATGYPVYGNENCAEVEVATPQAAPESFTFVDSTTESVRLHCESDHDIIVAATTEGEDGYESGYAGKFGLPGAGAATGEIIDGGGKIVYVGEAGEFDVEVSPNSLTYFRAWTTDGETLSATWLDMAAAPAISFPYAPEIENYPLGSAITGWEATKEQFTPVRRAYESDRALVATSIDNAELRLTTPEFISDRHMTLTFEYAMETERDAAVGEEGQTLMQGYEPGKFGETGYLRILSDNDILREITEYHGSMVQVVTGGNEDGSSSFAKVEVEVLTTTEPQKLSFLFATPKKSRLYLRNISLVQKGLPVGVDGIESESSAEPTIYSLTGIALKGRQLSELPSGVYIINGKKVMK